MTDTLAKQANLCVIKLAYKLLANLYNEPSKNKHKSRHYFKNTDLA